MGKAVALINGINYSWPNAYIILFNTPVVGVTKFELSSEQEKENNYGFGSDPVSRGYGRKKYEGSISLYWDEVRRIIDAAPNRDILDIPPFDISLGLFSNRNQPYNMVARMVEFTKNPFAVGEGDTKIIVDIPLIVARIDY
jgi:hypothetical protein